MRRLAWLIAAASLSACGCTTDDGWVDAGRRSTGGGFVATGGGFVATGGGFVATGGGFVATGGGFGGGFFAPDCGVNYEFLPPDLTPAPPISGGTLAVMSDGLLVIGDSDRDVLWVVHGHGEVIAKVPTNPGDEPGRVVEGPPGTAFVVLRHANKIGWLNTETSSFRSYDTCQAPRALLYRSTGELLVGCADGTIARHVDGVRTSDLVVDSKIVDLRDLVEDGERLIATSFRSAQVFSIDTKTGATTSLAHVGVPVDGVPRVAWRAVSTKQGPLLAYQTERTTPFTKDSWPSDESPLCASFGHSDDAGTPVVVSTVASIAGDSVQVKSLLVQAVLPVDLAANDAGESVVVGAGSYLVFGSWQRTADGGASGTLLHGQPTSVVARGDEWVIFERQPVAIAFWGKDRSLVELPLAGSSRGSTGHALFHRATKSNVACASCHPEAGDDAHTWPFAEGSRQTPTLRGGLASSLPFLTSGISFVGFAYEWFTWRMSGPQETGDRIQALLDWLDARPTLPPPPTDPARVARGAVLFASTHIRCAFCHSGPQGSNNGSYDIGTGGLFQVPRLVEAGWRSRWYHDGRVTNPMQIFDTTNAHGTTTQLTEAEKGDLLEYVKSR